MCERWSRLHLLRSLGRRGLNLQRSSDRPVLQRKQQQLAASLIFHPRDTNVVAVASVVVGLLLAGCTSGSPQSLSPFSTEPVVDLQSLPPEQRDAFEDGKVLLPEYQSGFAAFRACAEDSAKDSVAIESTDPETGLIIYGTMGVLEPPGPIAGSAVNRCYQTYFSYIELAWQRTDPTLLAVSARRQRELFDTTFRPCLEANGYEVPDVVEPGTEVYGELTVAATKLFNDGTCQ